MWARTAIPPAPAFEELGPEQQVTAVVVSHHESDQAFFRGIFQEAKWDLHEVHSFHEALSLLRRRPVALVISDRDLKDGSWRDILDTLKGVPGSPPLIVTSRLADDYLWAEVLNEGGFDVLAQPFDREEVVRVVSAASRRMQNEFTTVRRRRAVTLRAGA